MKKKHHNISNPTQTANRYHPNGLNIKSAVGRDPFLSGLNFSSASSYVPTLAQIKKLYGLPKTLCTSEDVKMAFDGQIEVAGGFDLLHHGVEMGLYASMPAFMGYAALQGIAQNGLIRACIETTADDMTRNWIEIKREAERADGKISDTDQNPSDENDDIIEQLKKEARRLDLQRVIHDAVATTGYYGGCLIFIDTGATDLKTPLWLDAVYSSEINSKGFLRGLRVIDPINVSPYSCNFTNPLAPDYYKPSIWNILGTQVHASRLIRIVANEAPLVFKPAYNFLGIPQAQLLWDYVLHFQKNRDNTNRLLGKFSSTILKTSMADILQGNNEDASQLDTRIQLFVRNRSNDGVFVIDKELEDILKLETPMSGLTDIVRQSLEILAAMNRTPAVKLLGISPSGFNATGESDLRNYYDYILSQQEKQLRPALNEIFNIMQLSLAGKIDSSVTFDFCSLSEEDESVRITTQKTKVDTLISLIDGGIISPDEARRVLIQDPDSGFNELDPDDLPEPPDDGGIFGNESGGVPDMGGESSDEEQKSEDTRKKLFGGANDEWIDDPDEWITTENGVHIPVKKGQTPKEASKNFFNDDIRKSLSDLGFKEENGKYFIPDSGMRKLDIQRNVEAYKELFDEDGLLSVIAEAQQQQAVPKSPEAKYARIRELIAKKAYKEKFGNSPNEEKAKNILKEKQLKEADIESAVWHNKNENEKKSAIIAEQIENLKDEPIYSDKSFSRFSSPSDDDFDMKKAVLPSSRSHSSISSPELTIKEKRAVRDYTGPEFDAINKQLINGQENEHVKTLDQLLDNSKAEEPLILFRGEKRAHDGKYPGFVSTTSNFEVAQKYAGENGRLYEVHVPAGMGAVSTIEYSIHPDEDEILLERNIEFKTKGYRKLGDTTIEIVEPQKRSKGRHARLD